MQQATQYGAGQGYGQGYGRGAARGALGPGARIGGAVICAALLGVEIAWLVRDIRQAGFHDTLWSWLGLIRSGEDVGLLTTGGLDAVYVVVLAGALAVFRRPGAGWAFVTAGLFALAYRVPGLWVFTADWADGVPLHDRAFGTGIGFTVAGLALIAIGLAGRRPTVAGPDELPLPPRTGPATAGAVVAVALALELIGWQIFYVQEYNDGGYPPHLYKRLLTGEGTLNSLLATPSSYAAWVTVVLAAVAAAAAFSKAPLARPLGIALGYEMVLNGVIGLDTWHTEKLLFKTDKLPDSLIGEQASEIFQVVVGLLLIVLLSQRGSRWPDRPAWGPPTPGYGAAPGGTAPGGAAPSAWNYGYPQQQPPAAGGFGPPPNLPPNLPPPPQQRPQSGPPSNYPSGSYPPGTPPGRPPGTPPPPAEPPRR